MGSFWDNVNELASTREANVETWLVLPLLDALGHERQCIDSKVPVRFQEGRGSRPGRKPEADFVVYGDQIFSRANSLIVVETKRPDELLDDGREQGESYAQNLRTPILIMTNGRRFEIWQTQITTESLLVLECNVAEMSSRRADIEGLLSKNAIKAHCDTIEYKRFDLLALDLGDYERAEHSRVSTTVRQAIPRTLGAPGTGLTTNSLVLLTSHPRGAVIVGASGFGKTILSASLLHEGLERHWLGETKALPIEIFLPHAAVNGSSFEALVTNRITAHKPGFTLSQLQKIAREDSLLIFADGYERVQVDRRDSIEGVLRTFLRDYPRTQLFVMARTAPIDINLPLLDLAGYTPEDLHELGRIRSNTCPEVSGAFSGAPEYVYRIGEVPILASLMLDRYAREQQHTTNLAFLYSAWLDQILFSMRAVDRALNQNILEEIAVETIDGPINVSRALELCRNRPEPESTLERLSDISAISVRGTTVELRHEALADYLRAIRHWRTSRQADPAALDALTFDTSSQFGLLLVATAPTSLAGGAAWQAVARTDMQLAIHSLRFAANAEVFRPNNTNVNSLNFLTDIRETIETLITSHLSNIGALLRSEIAGAPINRLGISGLMSADDVSYSFFEADGASALVRLDTPAEWERRPRVYGNALRRVGYGPEAGRILGVQRLQDALYEQVKARSLRGGPVWIEESAFGRLRHLSRAYNFPVSPGDLQDALAVLTPYDGQVVASSSFRSGQTFLISELIESIQFLLRDGILGIPDRSEGFASLDLQRPDGRELFSRKIDEYFRRRQIAYAEVVTESLPSLRRDLPTLNFMPIKYEIEVEFHSRRGYEDVTLNYRRWPALNYEEAGADITFPDQLSDFNSNYAAQDYVDRTNVSLARLGRPLSDAPLQWGVMRTPDFEGYDTAFDGLPDESAVVRGAMKWLRSDLEILFRDVSLR